MWMRERERNKDKEKRNGIHLYKTYLYCVIFAVEQFNKTKKIP